MSCMNKITTINTITTTRKIINLQDTTKIKSTNVKRQITRIDTPSTLWKQYFISLEISGVENHSYFP